MLTVAGTGHRPERLAGFATADKQKLARFAMPIIAALAPDYLISGLARGWDTAIAQAAITLGIPLIAAVPFEAQASFWPLEDLGIWLELKRKASEVHIICSSRGNAAYKERDEWMVNRADILLACWSGQASGTANCIRYAQTKPEPRPQIINVYNQWRRLCQ